MNRRPLEAVHCSSSGDQIRHHLFELTAIHLHQPEIGWQFDQQPASITGEALQQPLHVTQHEIGLQAHRRDDGLPVEGEQLTDQIYTTHRGAAEVTDLVVRDVARPHAGKRKVGVRQHGREQIVEVVRDATREATDRFQLLSFARPFLVPCTTLGLGTRRQQARVLTYGDGLIREEEHVQRDRGGDEHAERLALSRTRRPDQHGVDGDRGHGGQQVDRVERRIGVASSVHVPCAASSVRRRK